MTDKKYKYWLAVVGGQTVQFSHVAHMMAAALHLEGGIDYGAARIILGDELKLAVRDGLLRVRNPAGLGFHTFPHGDALLRAVLIPDTDLEPFLNARGIELRITPHGNGPEYWTLENAAAGVQKQLHWHDGTRQGFLDQMREAAQSGALVILDPRTCLPAVSTERVRTYWEYVTPDRVNTWLAALKAPYRWEVQTVATPAPAVTANDGPAIAPAVANWKMQVQTEATALVLRLRKSGANPTRHSILNTMAKWCRDNDIKTVTKIYPSVGYLREHVLGGKHWEVPR